MFTAHIRKGDLILYVPSNGKRIQAGLVSATMRDEVQIRLVGGDPQDQDALADIGRENIVGVFGPKSNMPAGWG